MPPKYYGAAAQYNKPAGLPGGGGMDIKKIGLIVGLVLFVIAILVVGLSLVSGISKGPQDDFVALAARTSNLASMLEKNRSNIKNGDLKKINAEAITLMLSDSVALSGQATTLFGVAEIPEAVTTAQAFTTAEESLDKAKVSGTFDRTYVLEITAAIDSTFGLAKKVREAVTSQDAQAAIDKTMTNMLALSDQLGKVQL